MVDVKSKPLHVLVAGGPGKTGRRVADRLTAAGQHARLASRSTEPAFDWDKPGTWPAALKGTNAVYAAYQPDLAIPGAAETVAGFAETARDAGIGNFVLLSGRGEAGAQRAETLVRQIIPATTVVRASWFFQNFDEGYLREAVVQGRIQLPAHQVLEPFIDADDIADVVVEALINPGHEGKTYEVTGPRLLSFSDVARIMSDAIGRPVVYTHTPVEEFARSMQDQGVPEDVTQLLSLLFTEVLDGHNASLAPGVQEALGRPARDFEAFARRAAASGVWDLPERAMA